MGVKIRPEIRKFAEEMELQMRVQDKTQRTPWKDFSRAQAEAHLYTAVDKVRQYKYYEQRLPIINAALCCLIFHHLSTKTKNPKHLPCRVAQHDKLYDDVILEASMLKYGNNKENFQGSLDRLMAYCIVRGEKMELKDYWTNSEIELLLITLADTEKGYKAYKHKEEYVDTFLSGVRKLRALQ